VFWGQSVLLSGTGWPRFTALGSVAVSGAGLGFVDVSFAVVMPAKELEVFEVGGSVVLPVDDVVGLTVAGWTVAAGGLAVLVAYDQRQPLRRCDGPELAADVEDFGFAVHDHSTDPTVTQQQFDSSSWRACPDVVAPIGLRRSSRARTASSSSAWTTMLTWGLQAVCRAELFAVERAAADVREGVHAPPAPRTRVIFLEVAAHFCVERGG